MISFRGYGYYPILRTKDAEINAYENLSPVLKDYCVPVFRLTTQKNIKDFAKKNLRMQKKQALMFQS